MKKTNDNVVQDSMMDQVATVAKAFAQNMEDLMKTAQMIVRYIDQNPDWIRKSIPYFQRLGYGPTANDLHRLEKIGRGAILPQIAMQNAVAFGYLEKCSPALQKKHLEEPLELLVVEGEKKVVCRLSPADVSLPQCKQLFAPDGTIRTTDQQIEYLKTLKPPEERPLVGVKGNSVWISRPFTKGEISKIIAELQRVAAQ